MLSKIFYEETFGKKTGHFGNPETLSIFLRENVTDMFATFIGDNRFEAFLFSSFVMHIANVLCFNLQRNKNFKSI